MKLNNYEFLSTFYCIDFLCLTINMSDSLTISVINGLNSIIMILWEINFYNILKFMYNE